LWLTIAWADSPDSYEVASSKRNCRIDFRIHL
jgi:hypothetical protein